MIAAILRSRNSANPSINSHDDERCLDARTIKSRGDVHCPAIERLSRLQLCMEGLDSVVAGISPFGPVVSWLLRRISNLGNGFHIFQTKFNGHQQTEWCSMIHSKGLAVEVCGEQCLLMAGRRQVD